MDLFFQLAAIAIFLSIFIYKVLRGRGKTNARSKTRMAPEPEGAWPILGHLHLLGGSDQLLYRTLGAMADEHGPAFTIRLGTRRAIVVSSWEVAKECFTPFWREMRKIATLELLSNRRLEMLKHVHISEVDMGIRELYSSCYNNGSSPMLVELKQWFEHLTLNVVVRMVAGKRYFGASAACDDGEAKMCQRAISQFFHLIGIFVVSDALPFLWWLDLQGHEKAMKKTAKELDDLLEGWLKEHRQRRISGGKEAEGDQDFIDVMLSLQEEGQLSNFQYDADTSIKSTCLALILGGSDTTAGTLTWAISLLLNHRDMLRKAQEELDLHVGQERPVDDSDIKNLVYLQAIIKETLRLYPAGPLLGPREAMNDCTVAGYHVAAGTRLIVNVWKIQRDSRVWSNPSAFLPERFLTSHADIDVRGQQFELIPFGSGRRSCPGASFALQVVHLTLARFLHAFELTTPLNQPVDMTESAGLTIPKSTPLDVLLKPRLPANTLVDSVKRKHCGRKSVNARKPPEAGGGWPLIGHLHVLTGSKLPYIALGDLSDKHGPIFSIRIGLHPAVVVSSSELTREIFTNYDVAVSSRPKLICGKYMGHNYASFGFCPYNAYWREMRKITASELLSNRRLELLKYIRASEVESSVKELYELWAKQKVESTHVPVEMKKWVGDLNLNVILRMIAGKRLFGSIKESDEQEARRCRKAVREFFHFSGLFVTAKEFDSILDEWLEEHRRKRESVEEEAKGNQDFIDVLLSVLEGLDLSGYDINTVTKATALAVLVGGTDTVTLTIIWTLALLLNNLHALEKVQEELDTQIGKGRLVSESDINKLVYLQATVKESLRLYPAGPLAGLWSDPLEFKPERFLTSHQDIDVRGQHFELIPFGAGRRSCPGISFGLQMTQLVLATFLHAFSISNPSDEPVDMTGIGNFHADNFLDLCFLAATPLPPPIRSAAWDGDVKGCERGGWPVLAFAPAALLLCKKQYSGEQKTLDMII
ncbi:hypothetical protein GQ457_HM000460 [Hibiscus cannabinus]